jgi:hypothetical protein
MVCELCGARRAKRACPALDQRICPVCCGTKRLVEIDCPSDCTYLTTAREHPPAMARRREQRDLERLVRSLRDLNERQSRLFLLVGSFLTGYQPPELHTLLDTDVAEAAAAVAATLETAARGVIYEHRPASLPAERLATAIRNLLAEAGKGTGSSFDRDAAVVLRRIEEAAREEKREASDRAFLDLVGRILQRPSGSAAGEGGEAGEGASSEPRLIVP